MRIPLLLCAGLGALLFPLAAQLPAAPIDRQAVVERHTIRLNRVDVESPLSVGNGDFAFTVDPTGLQTFEYFHDEGIPLETSSTLPWAWHEFPNTQGLKLEDAMMPHDFHGRTVMFAGRQNSPAGTYFRENPHPIPLGQISLWLDGRVVEPAELTRIEQTLNPWTGIIRSAYTLAGEPVVVETVAHATAAAAGIRIESPLVRAGRLAVHFRFPYSYKLNSRNKPPLAWDHPDKHRSILAREGDRAVVIRRELDRSRYFANVRWDGAAAFREVAPHHFELKGSGDALAFACEFAPEATAAGPAPAFADLRASSVAGWKDYWTKGGIIDLAGSTDPRAKELERRIILSLYLVKVNYAGGFPPSEDGLTNITWYGKHHSEMYYWHAAHFHAWGRTELLEKSLAWYKNVLLPAGRQDAQAQGFEGVRWPKMSGIDGRTGPGTINPYIIWNQPNPIALSELVYRAKPTRETLEQYRDVVFESAKFLASFAHLDPKTDRYVLGPPIKNVSESSGANLTQNPTFELAYWYYGLQVAQQWRERLGLAPDPKWADVIAKLSRLPVSPEGFYVEIETFPDIYQRSSGGLPTSMLMALGFMPQTDRVDLETMRRTFHEVTRRNGGEHSWVSWAYGQGALTAARLNEPATAVNILCNPRPEARFMTNGHVRRPKEPDNCPAYLPVNAALLTAVATMAGGWDGAPAGDAPGFPRDGSWVVRSEGLNKMP